MRSSRSGESALLLLDVVDFLIAQKFEYAVIGALAASIHGAVRASMDADVLLSVDTQQAKRLEVDFTAAGFHTKLTRGDFEDPIPGLLEVSDAFGNRGSQVSVHIPCKRRIFEQSESYGVLPWAWGQTEPK